MLSLRAKNAMICLITACMLACYMHTLYDVNDRSIDVVVTQKGLEELPSAVVANVSLTSSSSTNEQEKMPSAVVVNASAFGEGAQAIPHVRSKNGTSVDGLPKPTTVDLEIDGTAIDEVEESEVAHDEVPQERYSTPVHVSSSRAPHSPIRIDSDADFDVQFPGRVISGYEIDGSARGFCIYIGNCSVPFIVENCYLHNANGNSMQYYWNANLAIYNSQQGTIRNNTISYSANYGVYLVNSWNNTVNGNDLLQNYYGIYAYQGTGNQMVGNDVNNSGSYGIYNYRTTYNVISWCRLYGNLNGIYYYYGDHNSAANVSIVGSGTSGVYLYYSHWNRLENITSVGYSYGFYAYYSNNNLIESSSATNCPTYGVRLYYGDNNGLRNSTISNSGIYGLYIYRSPYAAIVGNNISMTASTAVCAYYSDSGYYADNDIASDWTGFSLTYDMSCRFTNNRLSHCGFYFFGTLSQWNTHDIPTTNTVNGRPVYYWKNGTGGNVPADGGQVILANYYSAVVDGLNVSRATSGVILGYSYDNTVRNCDARFNYMAGMYLRYSNRNLISNNNVSGATQYGFYLYYSDDNLISNNDVSGEAQNGFCLYYSDGNRISDNTIYSDSLHEAIFLYYSESDTIQGNVMTHGGIYIFGNALQYWNTHDIPTTNTVNGKPVQYWKNGTGGDIPAGAGQIIFVNYSFASASNSDVSWGSIGLEIVYSNNITVNFLNTSNNYHEGLYILSSNDITLCNITSANNRYDGAYLYVVNRAIMDNCTVENGEYGIYIENTYDSIFSNVVCRNITNYGVYLNYADRNELRNVLTYSTYESMEMLYANFNDFISCDFNQSNYGAYLYMSNVNSFTGCNFSNNQYYGMYAEELNGLTFTRSNFDHNGEEGLYAYYVAFCNFTWNNFVFNGNSGVYFEYSNNNTFMYNNFSSNFNGAYLYSAGYNSFLGCRFYFNTNVGAFLSSETENNSFHHNNFIDNAVQAYEAQGQIPVYAGSYMMGTNVGGNYIDNEDSWALSPVINCTGMTDVHLTLYRYLVLEIGYDYAWVEVSNDGGATFTQVSPTYNLQDASWTYVDLDISSIADNSNNVRIRFRFTSDVSIVFTGWRIDEVKLVSGATTVWYDGFETDTGWTFGGTNSDWNIGTYALTLKNVWDNTTDTGNYWSNWLTPDVVIPYGIVDIPYTDGGVLDRWPVTTPFILENFPPVLTMPSVAPLGGTTSTAFTYSITCSDANGNVPAIARVYIDGIPHDMSYISGSYTSGALYQYTTTLSEGAHTYSFLFDDGNGSHTSEPIVGAHVGPVVNWIPDLASGLVVPLGGTTGTTFVYSINYTDNDDNTPSSARVYIDGVPHDMSYVSGSNLVGALYQYSTTLSEGAHDYYFYFEDGNGSSVREPSSGVHSGPQVNYIPMLSAQNISPLGGTVSTTFTYNVTYSDADGNAPSIARVYIDGVPHDMSYVSGSNLVGALYQYSTTLSEGAHDYYFYFEDGNGSSVREPSSGVHVGPIVNMIPQLSSHSVLPLGGTVLTSFTYSVTYSDGNGDAPALARVFIDDTPISMNYISGSNQTGAIFQYTTTLSEGYHTYYFYFDDGNGSYTRLPGAGAYIGPQVNNIPTLYMPSVTPAMGNSSTTFTYSISYADIDGDAPSSMVIYIDGVAHNMSYVSGDNSTGALYQYSTTLSEGAHNYSFAFDDGNGSCAVVPIAGNLPGPQVNHRPGLTGALITPTFGNVSTSFTYSITYADIDGNSPSLPGSAVIYIDGAAHAMVYVSGDNSTGALYQYSTTLSSGVHTYGFYFDDCNGSYVRFPPSGALEGPVVNYVPVLSGGAVSPLTGNNATAFTYSVEYSDADGDVPSIAYAFIDGVAHNMSYVSGAYSTCATYTFSTNLTVGNHEFYFYFDDGNGSYVRLPGSGGFSGPVVGVNAPPVLSSPSVTPSIGNTSTIFAYSVIYSDMNGDVPSNTQVVIDGVVHTMTYSSGSYALGATFTFSTTLALGSHQYHFYFDDGNGSTARLPALGELDGPLVSVNVPPSLSLPSVTPTAGNETTLFAYSVMYADDEGSAPALAQVTIDGLAYSMSLVSGNAQTGAIYSFNTTLALGPHNYSFEFSDGTFSVRLPESGTYDGPTVSAGEMPYTVYFMNVSGMHMGGESMTIMWNYEYAPSPMFTLFYSTDDFVSNNMTIGTTSMTSYQWTLPSLDGMLRLGILLESNGKHAWGISNAFEVDSTKPTITLVSPSSGSCVPSGTTVDFDVYDAHIQSVSTTYIRDGTTVSTTALSAPYDVALSETSPCEVGIVVRATDLAGNMMESTFTFNVHLPLSVTLVSPSSGSTQRGTNITFEIKNASWASYIVDGGATQQFSNVGPDTYAIITTLMSEGAHTITVAASSGCSAWTANYTVVITLPIPPNQRPTITGMTEAVEIKDRNDVTIPLSGSDPDDATSSLKWSVECGSTLFKATLDEPHGVIRLSRNTTRAGEGSFVVRLTDPEGSSDNKTVHVTLREIKSAVSSNDGMLTWLMLVVLIAVIALVAITIVSKKRGKKEAAGAEAGVHPHNIQDASNVGLQPQMTQDNGAQGMQDAGKFQADYAPGHYVPGQDAHGAMQDDNRPNGNLPTDYVAGHGAQTTDQAMTPANADVKLPTEGPKPTSETASGELPSEGTTAGIAAATATTTAGTKGLEGQDAGKDTKALSSVSAQNDIAAVEIEPSKSKTQEDVRVSRLKKGIELCDAYGADVAKAKGYYARLENASSPEAVADTLKVAELFLKVTLKKSVPNYIKLARERIATRESDGLDSSINERLSKLEAALGTGEYVDMVDNFAMLDDKMGRLGINLAALASASTSAQPAAEKKEKTASSKPKNRNRLVFLDGKVYHINEPGSTKAFKILKGLSEENAVSVWLTVDANEALKGVNVPPDIAVKDLKGVENQFEAIIEAVNALTEKPRFAVLIDFLPSLMTLAGPEGTFRLIASLERTIKGKQAAILLPMAPSLLSQTERIEFRKLATPIDDPDEHLNWLNSPDRTITMVVRCAICMGNVKPGLPVSICSCGKKFHETCAQRVGDCPGCGRKF